MPTFTIRNKRKASNYNSNTSGSLAIKPMAITTIKFESCPDRSFKLNIKIK